MSEMEKKLVMVNTVIPMLKDAVDEVLEQYGNIGELCEEAPNGGRREAAASLIRYVIETSENRFNRALVKVVLHTGGEYSANYMRKTWSNAMERFDGFSNVLHGLAELEEELPDVPVREFLGLFVKMAETEMYKEIEELRTRMMGEGADCEKPEVAGG